MDAGIELIGIVDPGTFTRGRDYAAQGHAVVLEHDRAGQYVAGTCRGSRGATYTVHVEYELSAHGVLHDLEGHCSCPVQFNCKHTVAVLLQARRHARDPVHRRPHWERVLSQAFPDPGAHTTPLALAVSFTPDRAAGGVHDDLWSAQVDGILQVRPLRPGKRKPWVSTGATWTDVRNHNIDGADPAQVEALNALRRVTDQSDPWSLGEPTWISLDRTDNPGLWPVLADVVRAGVTFLPETAGGPSQVVLHGEPGSTHLTVDETDDGDVQVGAEVTHPKAPPGTSAHLLGTPPHGMLWVEGSRLHLAPLERVASGSWTTLHREGPVRVPAQDRSRFEQDVLPRILREPWTSPTGRYAPPQPPAPRLLLEVQVSLQDSGTPRAVLAWSFEYRDEHGEGYGPFDLMVSPGDPIRDPAAEAGWRQVAATALAPLGHPVLDGDTPRPRALLHGMAVVTLVTQVLPALEDAGVRIVAGEVPTFVDAGAPQVDVSVSEVDRDWFDLHLTMSVAGHEVPISHVITALTRGEEALFLPDGSYLRLDDPELEQLRALLAESYEMTDQRRQQLRVPRVQVSWWEELLALGLVSAAEHHWLTALQQAMHNPPEPPPLPVGLNASLRPYQRQGYQWLAMLRRAGLGGILADDMGLGKTLQVLAMILDERTSAHGNAATGRARIGQAPAGDGSTESAPTGPWLVVAPTSVVPNWASEAARFTPDLKVAVVSATQARRGRTLADLADGVDILVTSYALLRLEAEDYAGLDVAGLVLDEAQHAKNHTSKAFASARKVQAPVTFAVTGTPLENNLDELWAMTALAAPGLLGNPKQFRQTYRRPIERGEPDAQELLARLRRRVRPFLLRRTKDQVATDLPPKQEQVIKVDLTAAHRRIYDRHLQRERQRVLHLVEDLDRNRVEVLAALTRLRQLAIDASLVEPDASAQSSKLEVLIPLLREAAAEGHRVLVFSQFTRYLGRIAQRLREEGMGYAYLDGSTTRRAEVIRGFAEGEDPVFLISLKAGGVGLNLTMADYAILADPWWNPAVEAQAIDRTHRIGQQRPVMVYRLVATDTIEEKVLALQDSKRELVAGVLMADDDETPSAGELTASAAGRAGGASIGSPGDTSTSHGPATHGSARGGRLTAAELRELLA